jgi:hypothetical protein
MVTPISNTTPAQPLTPAQASSHQSDTSKTKPATADTVHLSSAAQSLLQEATESAAQTAKEAGAGDIQAQKLLAKETAERSAEN